MIDFVAEAAKRRQAELDVCECGDSRRDHRSRTGPCLICAWSNAPYDNCDYFRYVRAGEVKD